MTHQVCILGGTGFVGRHLIAELSQQGMECRVPSRHPQRHRAIEVGEQARLVQAAGWGTDDLVGLFAGCNSVINLVGILNEGRQSFEQVHAELPQRVAEACIAAGVPRLLHMSALNAHPQRGTSRYLRTKGDGEERVHALATRGLAVTSLRPSVIFGPDDSFYNRFAALLRTLPGPFPLACPGARFAPVYVGDVARAFHRALMDPATVGRRYDLCGPRALTLRELVEYAARHAGESKPIIGLGDGLSRLQARILGLLPGTPFSLDNYLSMQMDSICTENGLVALGITPTDMDAVMPWCLATGSARDRRLNQWRRMIAN